MISKIANNIFKKKLLFPFTTVQNPQVIIPKYWTGKNYVDDSLWKIDCTKYQGKPISSYADELGKQMNDVFNRLGAVMLKNTGLTDYQDMHKLMNLVIPDQMEYSGGSNDRNRLEKNVYDVGAPLTAHLHYHHEMAYVGYSTSALGFCCKKATGPKGATYISENVAVTDAILQLDVGKKLKERGICYHRRLTDRVHYRSNNLSESGVYNHWQQSFQTEDQAEAQKRAEEKGLKVVWKENRFMDTKFYVSAFEFCPYTQRNLLYSSVADDHMWFDSWPGVRDVHPEERPLKISYGDDSEFTWQEKKDYVDVYDQHGMMLDWEVGDVGVVCNYRYAHGRPGIHLEEGEERELGVVLGKTYQRQGDIAGKW